MKKVYKRIVVLCISSVVVKQVSNDEKETSE